MEPKVPTFGQMIDPDVLKRLKEFRERKGLSAQQLAEAMGVIPRTWLNYEAGISQLKAELFQKLATLGCDPTWLITGRASSAALAELAEAPGALLTAMVDVPHYAAGFSAGNGVPVSPESEDFQPFTVPEEWVRRVTGRNPKNIIRAHAEGSSMEPTIGDGDILLIDKTDQALSNSRIYALVVDETLFCKRIRRSIKGEIWLTSDNKSYPDEQLDSDDTRDIRIIGQVVWSGGALV